MIPVTPFHVRFETRLDCIPNFTSTMLKLIVLAGVSLLGWSLLVHAQDPSLSPTTAEPQSNSFTVLNATVFKQMLDDPTTQWFDAIVDVRTQEEWDEKGHIPGATLVDSLALFGTDSEIGTPADLAGCEYCNIVVYCNSGVRAAEALQHLINANFVGYLYSGLGITQWQAENYTLFRDEASVIPPCTTNETVSEQCRLTYLAYTSGGLAVDPPTSSDTGVVAPSGTSPAAPLPPTSTAPLGPAGSMPQNVPPTAPATTRSGGMHRYNDKAVIAALGSVALLSLFVAV